MDRFVSSNNMPHINSVITIIGQETQLETSNLQKYDCWAYYSGVCKYGPNCRYAHTKKAGSHILSDLMFHKASQNIKKTLNLTRQRDELTAQLLTCKNNGQILVTYIKDLKRQLDEECDVNQQLNQDIANEHEINTRLITHYKKYSHNMEIKVNSLAVQNHNLKKQNQELLEYIQNCQLSHLINNDTNNENNENSEDKEKKSTI